MLTQRCLYLHVRVYVLQEQDDRCHRTVNLRPSSPHAFVPYLPLFRALVLARTAIVYRFTQCIVDGLNLYGEHDVTRACTTVVAHIVVTILL